MREGQGPLYFLVLWSIRQIFGASEVVLRIPGVIFVVLTCLCLSRLGELLFGRGGRALPVFFFCLLPKSFANAVNARSYAMVVFLSTLSFLMIVQWVKTGNLRSLFLYILATVSLLYTHLIFAGSIAIHAVYVLRHRHAWRGFTVAMAISAVVSLPVFQKLIHLSQFGGILSWAPPLSLHSAIEAIIPTWFLASSLISMFTAWIWLYMTSKNGKEKGGDTIISSPYLSRNELTLLLLWCVIPGLIAVAYTAISSSSVLLLRYTQWSLPGFALTLTWITLTTFRKRKEIFLLLFLILNAKTPLKVLNPDEQWREAVHELVQSTPPSSPRANDPVFTYTGFIEAQSASLVADPLGRQSLLSPLLTYAPWIVATPLPTVLPEERTAQSGPLPPSVRSFFLLGRESLLGELMASSYLETEFHRRGYQKTAVKWFNGVFLMHFTALPEVGESSHQTPPPDTRRSDGVPDLNTERQPVLRAE